MPVTHRSLPALRSGNATPAGRNGSVAQSDSCASLSHPQSVDFRFVMSTVPLPRPRAPANTPVLDDPSTVQASFGTTGPDAVWHTYATDYQQGAVPVSPNVVFASASVGYAAVRFSLQRTVDGGEHWTALRMPGL